MAIVKFLLVFMIRRIGAVDSKESRKYWGILDKCNIAFPENLDKLDKWIEYIPKKMNGVVANKVITQCGELGKVVISQNCHIQEKFPLVWKLAARLLQILAQHNTTADERQEFTVGIRSFKAILSRMITPEEVTPYLHVFCYHCDEFLQFWGQLGAFANYAAEAYHSKVRKVVARNSSKLGGKFSKGITYTVLAYLSRWTLLKKLYEADKDLLPRFPERNSQWVVDLYGNAKKTAAKERKEEKKNSKEAKKQRITTDPEGALSLPCQNKGHFFYINFHLQNPSKNFS